MRLYGIPFVIMIYLSLSTLAQLDLHVVTDKEAKCLDGSSASYFFAQGYGEGEKKFLLYFQGGGWLFGKNLDETIESAYERSLTYLGSSDLLPKNYTWNSGILSRIEMLNPDYYNWNTVHINYCDGTGHQGFRKAPINHKGKDLYFRGNNNVMAIIDDLKKNFKLSQTKQVILSGCSAGAIAVFNWVNYFGDLFGKDVEYRAVPDSGVFIIGQPFVGQGLQQTLQKKFASDFTMLIANQEVDPINTRCVQAYPNEKEKCLAAQYLVDFIDYPMFIVQPQYDSWQIKNELQLHCADDQTLTNCTKEERAYIETHRTKIRNVVINALLKHPGWGAWSPSCVNHCYEELSFYNDPKYSVPQLSNVTIQKALHGWIQNDTIKHNIHIDQVKWPFNQGCSNQKIPIRQVEY